MHSSLNSLRLYIITLYIGFFLTSSSFLSAELLWFTDPTNISNSEATSAQSVINDNDQITVIWIDGGTAIKFANFTRAAGWTAPANAVASGAAKSTPKLAMNNSGQTMLIWLEGTTLKYSRRTSFDGTWSAPADVSSDTVSGTSTALAMNNIGQVLASWRLNVGWGGQPFRDRTCTFLFSEGTWSGPTSIRKFPSIGTINLALLDSGHSFLNIVDAGPTSWGGTSIVAFVSSFDVVRSLGFPDHQENPSSNTNLSTTIPTQLSVNNNSNGINMWVRADGSTIRYSTRTGSGPWSNGSFIDIKASDSTTTSLAADFNDSNLAIAAWTERSGSIYAVKVAVGNPLQRSNSWDIRTLSTTTNVLTDVRLAMDNRGEAIVVWNENVGGTSVVKGSSVHFIQNNAHIVETLSDTSKNSTVETVAGTLSKNFVVVWLNNTDTIEVARVGAYLLSPPRNPRGIQKKNRFLTQTEYYNHLSWSPSLSPSVSGYKVLANNVFAGNTSKTSFDHRGQKKGRPVTYTISSINSFGEESPTSIQIVVP